eukprot:435866-Pleurochrysis_carterae.AAC.1
MYAASSASACSPCVDSEGERESQQDTAPSGMAIHYARSSSSLKTVLPFSLGGNTRSYPLPLGSLGKRSSRSFIHQQLACSFVLALLANSISTPFTSPAICSPASYAFASSLASLASLNPSPFRHHRPLAVISLRRSALPQHKPTIYSASMSKAATEIVSARRPADAALRVQRAEGAATATTVTVT